MKNKTRFVVIIISIIIVIIRTFFLWTSGFFYIIDTQNSPDEKMTITVYNHNLSEFIPQNNGFTIVTSGSFNGERICTDGSVFEQLWWSPDSKYNVISTINDGSRLLEIKNYSNNSVTNLSKTINMSMSNYTEFSELVNDWETLQFNFIEWKEEQGSMTVGFEFTDNSDSKQSGNLDYNFETGVITNINFN